MSWSTLHPGLRGSCSATTHTPGRCHLRAGEGRSPKIFCMAADAACSGGGSDILSAAPFVSLSCGFVWVSTVFQCPCETFTAARLIMQLASVPTLLKEGSPNGMIRRLTSLLYLPQSRQNLGTVRSKGY